MGDRKYRNLDRYDRAREKGRMKERGGDRMRAR